MDLTWNGKAYFGVADKTETVTHVRLWSAGDSPPLTAPKSHEPEDVEAWLAEPSPASVEVELVGAVSLTPGATLTVDAGSISLTLP